MCVDAYPRSCVGREAGMTDTSVQWRAVQMRTSAINRHTAPGSTQRDKTWPDVVCPYDGQPLAAKEAMMQCPSNHRWGIDAGIPRMVSQTRNYADAFGLQWK